MPQPRTVLRIEELELRVALSGYTPAFVATAAPSAAPASQDSQQLRGTYTIVPSAPDTGVQYDLSGSGYIDGLGPVTATGELNSTGFIYIGHATGTLTLQIADGTVTLDLVGPSQPGFAPLPNQFQYTVESATGADRVLHESGTIDLQLQPSSSGTGGTFTMGLQSQGGVSPNAGGTSSPIDAIFQELNSLLETREAVVLNLTGDNAQIEALFRTFNSTLGSLESEIAGHPISI